VPPRSFSTFREGWGVANLFEGKHMKACPGSRARVTRITADERAEAETRGRTRQVLSFVKAFFCGDFISGQFLLQTGSAREYSHCSYFH
jgi:hypothetical protein